MYEFRILALSLCSEFRDTCNHHLLSPSHLPPVDLCPQWMQLQQRKGQMVLLFQRLQDYQFEKVREEPDKALTEDIRPLTEEDVARSAAVWSA